MPSVNQGIFKKFRNNYDTLKKDYVEFVKQYFPSDSDPFDKIEISMYNADYDICSDFAYDAESIYKDALNLKDEILITMKNIHLRDEDLVYEYEEIMGECDSMAYSVRSVFHDMLSRIDSVSDAEQNTYNSLNIYR